MSRVETEGHLGGYLVGGDPDTTFPDMWKWLVETWEAKTILDVGCGDGNALRHFREYGALSALGIDGVKQDDPDIYEHDFSTGPFPHHLPSFDLAWSAEFVEHVDEQYVPNFMPAFRSARFALITHAEPGSPGWHHVNCRTDEYWKGVFAGYGFEFDEGLTAQTRALASCNTRSFNHYRRGGLAFRRRDP